MVQERFAQKIEAGAIFVFNYDLALKTHHNPQRHFCFSLLKTICPQNDDCPPDIKAAFYELRVGPIDQTNWEALNSFMQHGNHFTNLSIDESEKDFVTCKDTNQLVFTPYIVAIWSDDNSVFSFVHHALVQNNIEGYTGCTFLDIPKTIEEFHSMCRQIDLGFDALVKNGEYLYPDGSDHPLKPEVMLGMGFMPVQR